jgi:sugar phosphate permease
LGWFSDNFGWDYLYILMAGISVLGGIVMVFLWNIKDDGYIH